MVTDAVLKLEGNLDLDMIGIKKEPGGSLEVPPDPTPLSPLADWLGFQVY